MFEGRTWQVRCARHEDFNRYRVVADGIVEHADDDTGYAHGRIDKMLADAGLDGADVGG
jgi:hypothetical protein